MYVKNGSASFGIVEVWTNSKHH